LRIEEVLEQLRGLAPDCPELDALVAFIATSERGIVR